MKELLDHALRLCIKVMLLLDRRYYSADVINYLNSGWKHRRPEKASNEICRKWKNKMMEYRTKYFS